MGCANALLADIGQVFPQPNKWGVFNKGDAIAHRYVDTRLSIVVYVLQVGPDCWLDAIDFTRRDGTGFNSPLCHIKGERFGRGERDATTEDEALDRCRQNIYRFCADNDMSKGFDAWTENLGRQRSLWG